MSSRKNNKSTKTESEVSEAETTSQSESESKREHRRKDKAQKSSGSSDAEDIPRSKKATPPKTGKRVETKTKVSGTIIPYEVPFEEGRTVIEDYKYGTSKKDASCKFNESKIKYDISSDADGSQPTNLQLKISFTDLYKDVDPRSMDFKDIPRYVSSPKGVQYKNNSWSMGLTFDRHNERTKSMVSVYQAITNIINKQDKNFRDGKGKIGGEERSILKSNKDDVAPVYEFKIAKGSDEVDETRGFSIFHKLIEIPPSEKNGHKAQRLSVFMTPNKKRIDWEQLINKEIIVKDLTIQIESHYVSKAHNVLRLKIKEMIIFAVGKAIEQSSLDDIDPNAEQDEFFWKSFETAEGETKKPGKAPHKEGTKKGLGDMSDESGSESEGGDDGDGFEAEAAKVLENASKVKANKK